MVAPGNPVLIGTRRIGCGEPCFVIAEAGVNHNGDLTTAKHMVDAAATAGVDAVKFQTFHAESVVSTEASLAGYQARNTGRTEGQLDMVRRLELAAEATRELAQYARRLGITFLSSPFDAHSVDLLDEIGVPAFKIGSGEITNHSLLRHIARKRRPVILSTGMASLDETRAAVEVLREHADAVCLLHCVSSYPSPVDECNLRAMLTLSIEFGCPVGWSDHTVGIHVALAAVALGAAVVEKHFTLDVRMPGPDHRASLEPDQLARLVCEIRDVESALGDGVKRRTAAEEDVLVAARRSLHAARDLPQGHVLTENDLVALRPGTGISPARLDELLGRTVRLGVRSGEIIREEHIGG